MIRNRRWHWALAALGLASCVSTGFADGEVACGSDGSCPVGLACAKDGRCRSPGAASPGATGATSSSGSSGGGGGTCTPKYASCAQASPKCGAIEAGCGLLLHCGCVSPASCDGGICGCKSPEVHFPQKASDYDNSKPVKWTGTKDLATSLSADDDNDARAALDTSSNNITHRLLAQDFGFTIADGKAGENDGLKITGVLVTVNRSAQQGQGSADVRDFDVRLVDANGATMGDNRGQVVSWPGSFGDATYGGASDSWMPNPIDVATVRSPGFGVFVTATTKGSGTVDAYVNYVKIAVCYSCPAPKSTAE